MPVGVALDISLGAAVQQGLRLPVYMDSIGTVLVGVLAGPLAGAATGALADLIWGYLLPPPVGTPTVGPFALTAAVIGFLAGIWGRLGVYRSRRGALRSAVLPAIIATAAALVVAFLGYRAAFKQMLLPFAVLLVLVAAVAAAAVYARRDLGVVFAVVAGLVTGLVAAVVSAPIAAVVFGGVTGSGFDLLVAAFRAGGAGLLQAVLDQGLLSDPLDKMITSLLAFLVITSLPRRVVSRYPNAEYLLSSA
jgi:energy-coupling factor transport system substrate-specific component